MIKIEFMERVDANSMLRAHKESDSQQLDTETQAPAMDDTNNVKSEQENSVHCERYFLTRH